MSVMNPVRGVVESLVFWHVFRGVQDGIQRLLWISEWVFGRRVLVCLCGICEVRLLEWKVVKWIEIFRDGKLDFGDGGLLRVVDIDGIGGRRAMMIAHWL